MTARRPLRLAAPTHDGNLFRVLISILLIYFLTPTTLAQTDYGSLKVIVTSSAGTQRVSGVFVSLTGKQGTSRKCKTNDEGQCAFDALEPGYYRIEVRVSATSQEPDKVARVRVWFGQRITREIALSQTVILAPPPPAGPEAALATTPSPTPSPSPPPSVPVAFDGSTLEDIAPGRRGMTGTTSAVEQLPNRNQGESALSDLLPGAFDVVTDGVGGISFNGQLPEQNVLLQGGLPVVSQELSTISFQDTGALIFDIKERQSLKTYESFSISTSNTPAKLGTGTGGQLLRDITSGGEKFKREAYEYFTHDALGARNFFDFSRKPALRFNLFGLSLSGPLYSKGSDVFPKLFAFVNYEGIRASSDNIIFEAAPSASLRAGATPSVTLLLDSFRAGGATIVPGASTNADLDILRLDSKNMARKNSVTARFDYSLNALDKLGFIYLGAGSKEDIPDGVTGRRFITRNVSHTAIFNYQRALLKQSDGNAKLTNQLIFGIQNDPLRVSASIPSINGLDLSQSNISLSGDVTPTRIPGKSLPMSMATLGGLLVGASFNGRSLKVTPRRYSFVDQMVLKTENHTFTFGGEVRLLRTTLDQLFGTTYSYESLNKFLANQASVEHTGDLGSFSDRAAAGQRKAEQEYFIGYAQDVWNARPNLTLTYGLRYEYYTVLRESRNRAVIFDPASGTLLPSDVPFYQSRKNNFLPRVAVAWAPGAGHRLDEIRTSPTVISASFGMHVGPPAFDNINRAIVSDRIRVSQSGGLFPADTVALAAAFDANTDDRMFKPLAISRDYNSPPRVYKFDVTLKRDLIRRETFGDTDDDDVDVKKELFVTLSYVGSRSTGLLLRNFTNRIVDVQTNPDPTRPAIVTREFDSIRNGQVLHPFGEIEYLTSGGRASFDSLQLTLKGRASKFLRFLEAQYTLAKNYGNTDGDDTAAAGNPLSYDYDLGFNATDVRHKFSIGTVFLLACKDIKPCASTNNRFLKELLGGWTIAAIGNFQTGSPIDVRLKRPDVIYIDAAGNVFNTPDTGRRAVINVPGGGSSVAAYRPNLILGVSPYLGEDRLFLNPAAFAIPTPGELGNLQRGVLRGPKLRLIDLSFRKELALGKEGGSRSLSFNVDVTNLFNFTNFKLSSAKLPNALGMDASLNQLQPGQPFTAEASDNFGILIRTFKRKQDLNANRQIQFGLSFKF